MILLDTNVISAIMRLDHEPAVETWFDRQNLDDLYVSTVALFESALGIERNAKGRKRRQLEASLSGIINNDMAGRILDFSLSDAKAAAVIRAEGFRSGQVIELADALIAGVAASRGATLATRNTKHFAGRGITLVDPWK